jgi:isopentenyl-diphosphate delta-isomerase
VTIFASGGLRDGIDVAKSIALGATIGGMAGPFLKAAVESVEAVLEFEREVTTQLRIAMFCAGAATLEELGQLELVELKP